jgi:citrate synthase
MTGHEVRAHPAVGAEQTENLGHSLMLTYRGYPVRELCRRHSFEEVAYLLWHGELPTRDQISAQNRAERAQRALPPGIVAAIADQPFTAHPMDVLRTAVTLLAAIDPAEPEITPAGTRAWALRLFAVLPSVIAMDQRRRHGLGAIAPRDHLSYAANFLYMTFGKVPEPQIVAAFETSLILYAGQGASASAFTLPAVTSARPDLYGAVTAAVGALNESADGGTGEAVVEMLSQIAIPDNAKPWLEEALAGRGRIAGFSHRLDKREDPRVPAMRSALGMIAAMRRGQDLIQVYEALAEAMYKAKGLRPSLDFPVGPAYHLIGFDSAAFTPILVTAQLPGWTARIAERFAADGITWPIAACDGSAQRRLVSGW